MKLSYPHICKNIEEIPEKALSHLDEDLMMRIGDCFTRVFPKFAQAFPKTSLVIQDQWTKPVLALKKGVREWLALIVVQKENKNLFFHLQPEFVDKEGELFDEDYEMLPHSWKELYRWFDSFCVAEEPYAQMNWWNTPFRFSGRLDLDDYEKGIGASKVQTEILSKQLGCSREDLRCFFLSENEDALFINEKLCDGRVFHVKGKNFAQVTELYDPQISLDDYLSFFLSDGNPLDYHFKP
ncbi:conserved hypothetical protein [Vibrio nigripulchritudo SFn27]|uniref:Uncharacterized protein n=1 Tax=Vibrio nigripulchritudo TaxID=28173 RepID=U4KGN1_9VIBR|nr:hypothetical protein [Vibrio nigripulchritudo]CCN81250.1 conserved hypothetical protein [Vibrio nigripulchritudo BLFn1]CCN86573.1 conserved hypothetical protein [Vibrio nigripulchritudo SFn27]CCN97180.1 conserved hypothetical protein [Vibrio nigripulchritudo ENn2]CCO42987.1 conserved hypothetical protein [Vibrio nigripulchritudo SFn135]CCO50623.1 conserved hypothetical protein [Vibrio nigripulchritudo Wn13]